MRYSAGKRFEKELGRLLGKFPSLNEDLESAKKATIELKHIHNKNNEGTYPVPGYQLEDRQVYKIKKFSCKSLKNRGCRSGFRIIYVLYPMEERVEFIEIYFKSEGKDNMDYNRADRYMKDH